MEAGQCVQPVPQAVAVNFPPKVEAWQSFTSGEKCNESDSIGRQALALHPPESRNGLLLIARRAPADVPRNHGVPGNQISVAHSVEQRGSGGDQAALAVEVDEGGPDAEVVDQRRRVPDAAVDASAQLDVLEGGAGLEDEGEGGGAGEEAQRLHLSVGGDDGGVVFSVGVELDEGAPLPLLLLLLVEGKEWVITTTTNTGWW